LHFVGEDEFHFGVWCEPVQFGCEWKSVENMVSFPDEEKCQVHLWRSLNEVSIADG